jgi:urea transport system permease protein
MLYMLAQEDAGPSLKSILLMQGFSGLSLVSVFLLMALGLSIIFGQMRVINMAHGEFLTLGAYVTVYFSKFCVTRADSSPWMLKYYYPAAIVAAFAVAFLLGYVVEVLLIKPLYKRPLDTLLATWGLSLIMQQSFRSLFGGRETGATLPDWLMGSWSPTDTIDIPINGVFLLGLCILLTFFVYLMLIKSRWGLRVRSTVLDRPMAGALGINTARTDRITFAIGCGLAGIAGAGFTTIGSVSPAAGSLYIVDTFMVVVFGGAGSLLGTIISAFSIGQAQSILEFFTSGVLAKVITLLGVIFVIMLRPQGLIASKVRAK